MSTGVRRVTHVLRLAGNAQGTAMRGARTRFGGRTMQTRLNISSHAD